jgi:hypothetical protein
MRRWFDVLWSLSGFLFGAALVGSGADHLFGEGNVPDFLLRIGMSLIFFFGPMWYMVLNYTTFPEFEDILGTLLFLLGVFLSVFGFLRQSASLHEAIFLWGIAFVAFFLAAPFLWRRWKRHYFRKRFEKRLDWAIHRR